MLSLKWTWVLSLLYMIKVSAPYLLNKITVLVWLLFYCPSTHFRSFRARLVTLTILFLGKPHRQFTSLLHILSPVTDNCSCGFSGRGRMAVKFFSWPSLHKRMCRMWGSNSGSLACQADMLPIELPRPVPNDRFWPNFIYCNVGTV